MKTANALREQAGKCVAQAKAIADAAKASARDISDYEEAQISSLLDESDKLKAQADEAERQWKIINEVGDSLVDDPSSYRRMLDPRSGQFITCVGKGGSLARLFGGHSDLSIMNLVAANITGDRRRAEKELAFMATDQGTGINHLGGMLAPDFISANVFDKARPLSRFFQAGSYVAPMSSGDQTWVTIADDPTMEVKSENASFSGSNITFGSVNLHAFTIGTIISSSRELVQDAPNWPRIAEETLARALASELDRQAIMGTGSSEMLGVANKVGVGSTTSVGAVSDYSELLTAVEALETLNFQPNALVCHPDVSGAYRALVTGDGTNASKAYMAPPPAVGALQWLGTTNVDSGTLVLGDWTRAFLGVRLQAEIAISENAGDSFAKNQLLIRVVWRGDVAVEHSAAFHVMSGIS